MSRLVHIRPRSGHTASAVTIDLDARRLVVRADDPPEPIDDAWSVSLAEHLGVPVELDLDDPMGHAWRLAVAQTAREVAAAGALRAAPWRDRGDALEVVLGTDAEAAIARRSRLPERLERCLAEAGRQRRVELVVEARTVPAAALLDDDAVEAAAEALASRRTATPESGEELWGQGAEGRIVPLASCVDEGARVTVEGRVFHAETRELRGGRGLCLFHIWDGSDSIVCKIFGEHAEVARVADRLASPSEVRVRGTLTTDTRGQDLQVKVEGLVRFARRPRLDNAAEKRVELLTHTRMSAMDGLVSPSALVARAAQWGHEAVAITDHGVVQGFPEAHEAAQRHGIKVLYGMDAYLVADRPPLVMRPDERPAADSFVALDLETTGLSPRGHGIIEIGAVRWDHGEPSGELQLFVASDRPLPTQVVELTGIRDEDLVGAPAAADALQQLLAFVGDRPLVAHNAAFDAGFLYAEVARLLHVEFRPPVADTMWMARALLPEMGAHGLAAVAKALKAPLSRHHRALADAETTAIIYRRLLDKAAELGLQRATLADVQAWAARVPSNRSRPVRATIFARSAAGLRALYELVTISHLEHFYRVPRIPRGLLDERRAELLVGAGCADSEVVEGWLAGEPEDEWHRRLAYYDFLQVVPRAALRHLVPSYLGDDDALASLQRSICDAGRALGTPVVAVGDVHHLDPDEAEFRAVLHHNQHHGDEHAQELHLRTTDEMLAEFAHLGGDEAQEVVVAAPRALAAQIQPLVPLPEGLHAPHVDGAEEDVTNGAWQRAKELYGEPLPEPVEERLKYELERIIGGGYAALYIIAARLVQRSLSEGYLVGSRGSVGSSLVATMLGITEVNPLPPHYRCAACRWSDFSPGGDARSGFDLPSRTCPRCGEVLAADGHDIPFASFMGFEGEKVPDIDLNFSGEYQARAHKTAEELLGEGQVFRAGTISTVAERTAFGLARAHAEAQGRQLRGAELERLALGCTGVKRTTGQHPGGLMVVPRGHDVHEFTPLQRPANAADAEQVTTHFDYHSISGRLVKLDLLGHDDPTAIRMLQSLTGVDPHTIPFSDEATRSLFSGCEALGVSADAIGTDVGSLGIPEFGTRFVRGMLDDTKPTTFADLVRISGLSHGTDVWANNARDLTRAGTATLAQVISTRDDIFLYLNAQGMDRRQAFLIGERVRKGKGLRDEDAAAMKAVGVPAWYIESCRKISYLFPKAHAAAYVMMAFRIAWFKVHHPAAFYATWFTLHGGDVDAATLMQPMAEWRQLLETLDRAGAPAKDRNQAVALEVAIEMQARGLQFLPVDVERSDAGTFRVESDTSLRIPFAAVAGLGQKAAASMVAARADGPFRSKDDFRKRSGAGRAVMELLQSCGAFGPLPENDQLTLF